MGIRICDIAGPLAGRTNSVCNDPKSYVYYYNSQNSFNDLKPLSPSTTAFQQNLTFTIPNNTIHSFKLIELNAEFYVEIYGNTDSQWDGTPVSGLKISGAGRIMILINLYSASA